MDNLWTWKQNKNIKKDPIRKSCVLCKKKNVHKLKPVNVCDIARAVFFDFTLFTENANLTES